MSWVIAPKRHFLKLHMVMSFTFFTCVSKGKGKKKILIMQEKRQRKRIEICSKIHTSCKGSTHEHRAQSTELRMYEGNGIYNGSQRDKNCISVRMWWHNKDRSALVALEVGLVERVSVPRDCKCQEWICETLRFSRTFSLHM